VVKAHVVDDLVTITLSVVQLWLTLNNLGWPHRNKFYPQQYWDQCPGRFLGIISRSRSLVFSRSTGCMLTSFGFKLKNNMQISLNGLVCFSTQYESVISQTQLHKI
jgi:hypothetical protein